MPILSHDAPQRNMAEARTLEDFVEQNLHLLIDNADIVGVRLSDNLSQQEKEEVDAIFDAEEVHEPAQDDDLSDFENEEMTCRHVSLNEDQVNSLADKRYKDTTKLQTQWAVNVFKGTFINIFPL